MDRRSQALLAVGIALLTMPVWAPALDLTGPDYVYRSAEVTTPDDEVRLNTTDGGFFASPTDQVACMDAIVAEEDRGCLLERRLRNETVTVPANAAPDLSSPEYFVMGSAGPIYRRVDTESEPHQLRLERVDPESALANASFDARRPAVERVLEEGRVRTSEPLSLGDDDSNLYAHEGGYAVVYEASTPVWLSPKPAVERGFELVALLLGAALVFRVGERNAGDLGD
jgi:hypothetical protein